MNRYEAIIERIFQSKHRAGMTEIEFEREQIAIVGQELGLDLPKNLGDIVYSFRYRAAFPSSIRSTAPAGKAWIITGAGRGRYRFQLVADNPILPRESMVVTKVPDATPGIIASYALTDEQALLAKVRYNRLVDIFTGVACYSLQNHLRTVVRGIGQVETDEIYVGVDRRGAHYVIPVQAKGGRDRLSVVQIEQDMALCAQKFPLLLCRPVACQFTGGDVIVMFEFRDSAEGTGLVSEKHYKLVPPDQVTEEDLRLYSQDAM